MHFHFTQIIVNRYIFADILALAESIRALSVASRRIRTSMWSALQATNLFHIDMALASGEKELGDEFAFEEQKMDSVSSTSSSSEETTEMLSSAEKNKSKAANNCDSKQEIKNSQDQQQEQQKEEEIQQHKTGVEQQKVVDNAKGSLSEDSDKENNEKQKPMTENGA